MKQRMESVIIPCYNEFKTINSVVTEVKKSPLVREIIVINDGSYAKTTEILRK